MVLLDALCYLIAGLAIGFALPVLLGGERPGGASAVFCGAAAGLFGGFVTRTILAGGYLAASVGGALLTACVLVTMLVTGPPHPGRHARS